MVKIKWFIVGFVIAMMIFGLIPYYFFYIAVGTLIGYLYHDFKSLNNQYGK